MKRFIALLVLLLQPAFAFAQVGAFRDVPFTHPNNLAITWVKQKGIVSGYSDGTYKPNALMNRAEFTKIVVLSRYSQAEIDDLLARVRLAAFPDVSFDAWFAQYVYFANASGIIAGYPDGTFGPEKTINYAEAAKIVSITYGFPVSPAPLGQPWYLPYVSEITAKNSQPPSIRSFDQKMTRGDMAELIYRLKGYIPLHGDASSSESAFFTPPASSSVSSVVSSNPPSTNAPAYLAYQEGVIGNGQKSVLFFHASWCPYCKANDARLTSWYSSETMPVPTYKVDYDTQTSLKSRFGVTSQDTFVLIDGSGNEITRVTFPSESMLRDLLNR
ncbi:S-layer homology domain-containing protein [Candidatus Peregrinibacteria bacterium]|nr:S-layer homology domain-containing protein [Candidatus Peregrinibacteria bacterium]